ncbi:MAG: HlyD family secretion protein, partial [Hyphomicrobiaceae bacterium]
MLRVLLRIFLLVVVPLAAVAAAALVWLWGGRYVTTENAYVKAGIVQISAEIAGRVKEVRVRDHAAVQEGDVLVTLDAEPFTIGLAKVEAEMDTVRGQVATMVALWSEAQSELKEAESKAVYWQSQSERQSQLTRRGIVAASKQEEVESNAVAARDRVAVMREKVQRMAAQLDGDPSRPIDRHSLVREKRAERDRAALDLARTTIRAPVGGIAVNVRLQPGEHIRAATPLFALVSSGRPW